MEKAVAINNYSHMIGGLYSKDGMRCKIKAIMEDGDRMLIKTDIKDFRIPFGSVSVIMEEFKPVSLSKNSPAIKVTSVEDNDLKTMRNVLMDSLSELQGKNPDLQKSKQISATVGTLLNLAKTEIEIKKAAQEGLF